MAEQNIDVATAIATDLKPLFFPEDSTGDSGTTEPELLAPTLENLKAAMGKAIVPKKDYVHQASGMKFKIQAMSSSGYTALNNVTKYNLQGYPMSSPAEDEFERQVILLMHGIAEPKLPRKAAEDILNAPNWGPSNIGLIDAINEINPATQDRLNNTVAITASARFNAILLAVFSESGALDDFFENTKINEKSRAAIRYAIRVFGELFSVEQSAAAWGIPLNRLDLLLSQDEVEEDEAGTSEEPEAGNEGSTE